MKDNYYQPDAFYYERQYFAVWVYLVLVVIVWGTAWAYADIELRQDIVTDIVTAFFIFLVVPMSLLFFLGAFRMNTEIRKGELYIYFGILFPMLWKRIPLEVIAETQSVVYRPLRDAGGWGYRRGRFAEHRVWFYSARGNKGVFVTTLDGGRYIIGSQQPDVLKTELDRACLQQQER